MRRPAMTRMKTGTLKPPLAYASIPDRHVETNVITNDQGRVAMNHVFSDMGLV
jgi:hypothetical protein